MASLPLFYHLFVNNPDMSPEHFNAALFMARRKAELQLKDDKAFYIASLSAGVLSYKGLMMPVDLPGFFKDLADPRLETAICVFHQRFSTNTMPQWPLAQPFRMLAHNGEINTVVGNRNWSVARTPKFKTPLLPDLNSVVPLVNRTGSDSSSMDNMLEVLTLGGVELHRAIRMLIPPAWQNVENMDPDVRAFYEYNSKHIEPWDGPAGLVVTDGRYAVCTLDRNGLRPSRWVITNDDIITVASEVGVYAYKPEDVVAKGRLGPGQIMSIDTATGNLYHTPDIDQLLKSPHPYKQWMKERALRIESTLDADDRENVIEPAQLNTYMKMFQVSFEERDQLLRPLAEGGQEAVGSMGDDTPMAVLSRQQRSIFDYFRQQFAQVTNPPIDPLREAIVMSLETCLGRELSVYEETPAHADRIILSSPVLSPARFRSLMTLDRPGYERAHFSLQYNPSEQNLQQAIARLCEQVADAVRSGSVIMVLNDNGLQKDLLPIPALLAVGAVNQHLTHVGLRCDANIIIKTGAARDPHQVAALIGYGATAVYPYLSYHVLNHLIETDELLTDVDEAYRNYRKGINKGLMKILSKMGISTIASYRGAQLFEAIGLSEEVISTCFESTPSRISGARFEDLEADQKILAQSAWIERKPIPQGGLLKYVHGSEYHAFNPDVVQTLQKAVQSGNYALWRNYADLVNQRPVSMLRDLLSLREDLYKPIPLSEVEPVEEVIKRFDSAGMSLGALSPEAHEALAEAMNRLGGRSNSGEGGEDPARYGTIKSSKIKQIASGRFGVTPAYLVNADVLQIKVAQGAKPGEGGQLPGGKVNSLIARLRYSVPGVTLISPPPHHDIYSIEDLAQLIFDLKQVNPDALISVKLVSEPGVGTIAAGVAKAYADLITISGYDGGTAASPLTSIKYAGSPWELGLSEAHQTLRANNLRGKIRLQTDGGLKTGLDVIKAAILGAESFGFGTAPMVALGCKYLRICHLNNCATGIATQDRQLRELHFTGLPEKVENYFELLRAEVEYYLRKLGVTDITDLIGRTDLLTKVESGLSQKQSKIDLGPLLASAAVKSQKPLFCAGKNAPHDQGKKNQELLEMCSSAVRTRKSQDFTTQVRNDDRSIGAALSGLIARTHGLQGLAGSPIRIHCHGTAGQSFGVWNAPGLHLFLTGDANDYVGKGMAGGRISIKPASDASFASHQAVIMGNTCLYGATGGRLFAAGLAGERFAVRNSGCIAVVEGIGDNGCEYMTGGVVVVLGQTGINFGAGMTGGMAYILDEDDDFNERINAELVEVLPIEQPILQEHLRGFIHDHMEHTGSERSRQILADFHHWLPKFRLVKPKARELHDLLGHRPRSTDSIRVEVM